MDNVTALYLRRQIALLRAAEGDAIAFAKILDRIHARIANLVNRKYSPDLTAVDANKLVSEIAQEIAPFFKTEFKTEFSAIAETVAASELVFNTSALATLTGKDARDIVRPALKQTIKKANEFKYNGKTFDSWLDQTYFGYTTQIKSIIDNGILDGESVADIASRVNSLNAGNRASTKTLVRSYVMNVSSEAKEQVAQLNPRIVTGWIWSSTLDNRTTWDICGIRDQLRYTIDYQPIGHDLPWGAGAGRIHFNCRSTSIPIIDGVNSEYSRPSVGAGDDYERGDNLTRNGTVRKPTKANRDKGIYEFQRVTTLTRYEGFLKSEAKNNIDFVADILRSKQDAILFRDGKVTLLQLAKTNPAFNPTNRNAL